MSALISLYYIWIKLDIELSLWSDEARGTAGMLYATGYVLTPIGS